MGNKVVVALLAVVVLLLAAVLVIGALFLTRDTRSKATQLREAQYDRCVARVEEKIGDSVGDYEIVEKRLYVGRPVNLSFGYYDDEYIRHTVRRGDVLLISAYDFSRVVLSRC